MCLIVCRLCALCRLLPGPFLVEYLSTIAVGMRCLAARICSAAFGHPLIGSVFGRDLAVHLKGSMEDGSLEHSLIATANTE